PHEIPVGLHQLSGITTSIARKFSDFGHNPGKSIAIARQDCSIPIISVSAMSTSGISNVVFAEWSLRMCSHEQQRSLGRATQHASARDFCNVFHQDMDVLYWLALTLTSDESKAEQCFVAGLDECIEGNSVFKEWVRSWSRRVVIKNAIQVMSPRPDMTS